MSFAEKIENYRDRLAPLGDLRLDLVEALECAVDIERNRDAFERGVALALASKQ